MAFRRPTLLLVDDDPGVLAATLRTCERLLPEMDVLTASDPKIALRILRDGRADVVVTDFRMPEMDGLAFLEQARLVTRDFEPLLLTAYLDDGLRRRCDALRLHVLGKPFSIERLAREVRAAYARRMEAHGAPLPSGPTVAPV